MKRGVYKFAKELLGDDPDVQRRLKEIDDKRDRLYNTMEFSSKELSELLKDKSPDVQIDVLNHSSVQPEHYRQAFDQGLPEVHEHMARFNDWTPDDVLHKLAGSKSWEARYWLAQNPRVQLPTLRKLVRDPSQAIRMHASYHPNADAQVKAEFKRRYDPNDRTQMGEG